MTQASLIGSFLKITWNYCIAKEHINLENVGLLCQLGSRETRLWEKRISRCTKEKEKRLSRENKNVKENERERGGGVRTVPAAY